MAKIIIGLFVLCIVCFNPGYSHTSAIDYEQTEQVSITSDDAAPQYTKSIYDVIEAFRGEIGVREVGGNNRGEDVEKYLATANLGPGHAWCVSFVNWAFESQGFTTIKSPAWSPSWAKTEILIYKPSRKVLNAMPETGDVFTIYYTKKGRVGHGGFLNESWINDSKYIQTVEGNTNEAGSREGDGVLKKKRLKSQIYAVSRLPNVPRTRYIPPINRQVCGPNQYISYPLKIAS